MPPATRHGILLYYPDPDPSNNESLFSISIKIAAATQWTSRVSTPLKSVWYVTKFATHKALKTIVRGKLTFDERVELHRVVTGLVVSYKQ